MQESFDKAVREALGDYQCIGAALDTFTEKTELTSAKAAELFSCSK
jgi:hypothetical protein